MKTLRFLVFFTLCIPISGIVFAQNNTEIVQQAKVVNQEGKILKRKVAIGRFSNETQYGKGIFYDKENDPMAKQALDILSAKLAASGKFLLLERSDLESILKEAQTSGNPIKQLNADYMIIGSITEFGRKNIGKEGLLSSSKTQKVDAAVSIRIVDVSTGLVIYSDEAKGSAELTSETTLGIGSSANYDASLSDKAISSAIGQLVENIINKCTDKPWRTYILSADDKDDILIAGGKSQGIEVGNIFIVKKKGRKVKNPQTGVMIELPGKSVGKVKVTEIGGDTPETEYSFVELVGDTKIDTNNLSNYYIEEQK